MPHAIGKTPFRREKTALPRVPIAIGHSKLPIQPAELAWWRPEMAIIPAELVFQWGI